MIKLALILGFFIPNFYINAQGILAVNTLCNLPSILNESSGLEMTGVNSFWSHNDSGGLPQIYKFDSTGVLLKTLTISNASNVDWEELTSDKLNNIYIGDFGNNNNSRTASSENGLRIYKISNPDLISGNVTNALIINFEYEDRDFAAPSDNHNFDMEAFFFYKDSLHLFTKNHTNPSNGWVKHYALPSVAGTYIAQLVDSFNNDGYRITSADISPNEEAVVLLSNDKVWFFQCFEGSKFISTGFSVLKSIPLTQKEAIVFANDSLVYMSDENSNSTGQKLYRSKVGNLLEAPLVLSTDNQTLCEGQSATITANGAETYLWNNGYTGQSLVVSPTSTTTYSVIGTTISGCKKIDSLTEVVMACNALKENSQYFLTIYYDSETQKIIVTQKEFMRLEMTISNVFGELVFSNEIYQKQHEFDLKNLSKGFYFVHFISAGQKIDYRKIRVF